jgi:hypothetical protein
VPTLCRRPGRARQLASLLVSRAAQPPDAELHSAQAGGDDDGHAGHPQSARDDYQELIAAKRWQNDMMKMDQIR